MAHDFEPLAPEAGASSLLRSLPWSVIGVSLALILGFALTWRPGPPERTITDPEELRDKLIEVERILDPIWEKLPSQRANELLQLNRDLGLEEFLKRVALGEFKDLPGKQVAGVRAEIEALGLGEPVWKKMLKNWALVPQRWSMLTFGSHMFLHSNVVHLLLSLLFVVPLGLFLDRRWEPGIAPLLFLAGGYMGGVVHWIADARATEPAVGTGAALSAWAGAMLPYLYDHPYVRLRHERGFLPALVVLLLWPAAVVLIWYLLRSQEAQPVHFLAHGVVAIFGLVVSATVRTGEFQRKLPSRKVIFAGAARTAAKPVAAKALHPTKGDISHLQDDWLDEKQAQKPAAKSPLPTRSPLAAKSPLATRSPFATPEPPALSSPPAPMDFEDPVAPEQTPGVSAAEEARAALERHDWPSAHHWLTQALAEKPDDVESLEGMVRACLALTRDEQAYEVGQKLLVQLVRENRRDKAIVVYDKLWSKFGKHGLDPISLGNLARFYEQASRYDRATELYGQIARSRAPDAVLQKAILRFGQLLAYRLGEPQRAQQALQHLLKTYPDTPLRAEAMDVLDKLKQAPPRP